MGSMSEQISWTNVIRKLGELQPWERNPRQIRDEQAARLRDSFHEFGQVEPIAIGPSDEVYNGHQRLNVLMAQYGPEYEIECRQASRALSEREREKLTVYLHKGAAGEWDFDILANEFDFADLTEWGFKGWELGIPEEIDDPNAEWQGMPEYGNEQEAARSLHIHFLTQADCSTFCELLGLNITEKTKSLWYPKEPIHDKYLFE
jgi:hypothetical protein